MRTLEWLLLGCLVLNAETVREVGPDKRVLPKSSSGSYLYQKLTQRQPRSGGQMPLGGSPLDTSDIKLIQTWIDEGALAKKP